MSRRFLAGASVCIVLSSAALLPARHRKAAPADPDQSSGAAATTQNSDSTTGVPTTAPANASATAKFPVPMVDLAVARRFGADALKRLAAINASAPVGSQDYIKKQKPTRGQPTMLPSEMTFMTLAARQVASQGDHESLRQFTLDLAVITHLVRDVPATAGTDPNGTIQPALLEKLQQLRNAYDALAKDPSAAANAASGEPSPITPAATESANTFYSRATTLIRQYLKSNSENNSVNQQIRGTPVLDDQGNPRLDAQGTPLSKDGVLGEIERFKGFPSEQNLSGLDIEITRLVMSVNGTHTDADTLAHQLDAMIKPLDTSKLFPHVTRSQVVAAGQSGMPAHSKHLKPAPETTIFRGTRVYTVQADGSLHALRDGNYVFEGSPLLVRDGEKTIVNN